MSTTGTHTRNRHVRAGGAAGVATRSTHGSLGFNPIPTDPLYGSQIDIEMLDITDIPAGIIDGSTHILPGSLPATVFDGIPPALPTGLTLSSDVSLNSDGGTWVRLLVGLVQPADSDLYGSYVEVTSQNDGAEPPNPVWDRPTVVLITKNQTQGRIDDVQGVTQFWARARAADVQGNFSAFTATVTHTTVGDTTPPPTPGAPVVAAGYRGFGAFWTGGDAKDLAYYELRWAQAAAPPDSEPGAWTVVQVKGTAAFVSSLQADLLYWVEVRGVDLSGNASAWSGSASVTPTLIGSTDIAANSITAAMIQTLALNADNIGSGTLRIYPLASGLAQGILVLGSGGEELGKWDSTGLKIREVGTPRYVLLDGGALKFTQDDGGSFETAINADGINASAVRFGSAAGGHNLILNSSFELAGFVAAPSTAVFTDNAGTPGWKAANRTTAPVNTTEGAADLQIAAMAF